MIAWLERAPDDFHICLYLRPEILGDSYTVAPIKLGVRKADMFRHGRLHWTAELLVKI